ncbi:short-chain dehydrogenase [Halobacteriales archaeon QS_8_65_32]|jgi:NAD(P)-dependent dehydrogenase (short-subunit alcohol dehydrogenase family)|nr:MAG: short-chain dehydrogenase [Halobacteriales archaeon QS_8_65_32]
MSHTAVIAGVGPGLGESLVRKFAAEGCSVGMFARSEEYLADLDAELTEEGHAVLAAPTDITDPAAVDAGFEAVREAFGPVDVLINHASGGAWKGLTDISPEAFERAWRVSAQGALLCSQAAVSDMLAEDGGTVLCTGATSAIRGRENAVGFSAAKFAVRGLAESMARELGPQGIHVCHVVVDGGILPPGRAVDDPDEYLDPDAIAESYWHLTEQDESAWTLELDLRPHVESF